MAGKSFEMKDLNTSALNGVGGEDDEKTNDDYDSVNENEANESTAAMIVSPGFKSDEMRRPSTAESQRTAQMPTEISRVEAELGLGLENDNEENEETTLLQNSNNNRDKDNEKSPVAKHDEDEDTDDNENDDGRRSLIIVETNLDEIVVDNDEENIDETTRLRASQLEIAEETEEEVARNRRRNSLLLNLADLVRDYLDLPTMINRDALLRNEYIRMLKPTLPKLVFLLIALGMFALMLSVPYSFSTVEFDEIALVRNKWTGYVNGKTTYSSGLHFLLPWKEFIVFSGTSRVIRVYNMKIFTTDKLAVTTSFKIYYFVDRSRLGALYKKFGKEFEPILHGVCVSELQNSGQKFSLDDYRTRRPEVKSYLKKQLAKRLTDDNYFVDLFELFFEQFDFTDRIDQINLERTLNAIYNEKAQHARDRSATEIETTRQVERINNQARLVTRRAESEAQDKIMRVARADQYLEMELAHARSLNQSLDELDFHADPVAGPDPYTNKKIISFCYLSSLINIDQNKLHIFGRDLDSTASTFQNQDYSFFG